MDINRIHLGDTYEMIKDLPDKSIDLIVTDPPYEYTTGVEGGAFASKNRTHHKDYMDVSKNTYRINERKVKNRNDIMHLSSGIDFSLLHELDRVMKKINIYIWCSKAMVSRILNHYESKGCNIDILTWHKTNPIPTANNTYMNDTEYCIFAREKGVRVNGTIDSKRKYYVTPLNIEDKDLFLHPTIKPLNIIKNLIINSSNEGDIVLDPFLGSGTTAVASKELGRNYIGFEINDDYYRIACERLNGYSQEDIKLRQLGQMNIFDLLEKTQGDQNNGTHNL